MRTITAKFPASGITIRCEYAFEPGLGTVSWEGAEDAIDAFNSRRGRKRLDRFEGGHFLGWVRGMSEDLGEPVEIAQEGEAEFTPE